MPEKPLIPDTPLHPDFPMPPMPNARRVHCVELREGPDVPAALRAAASLIGQTDMPVLSIDVQTEHSEEYGVVVRIYFALPRS
jgi:hypothetical protein